MDLTEAFDTVKRDGLWKILQKFGCPERFTYMMSAPRHDDRSYFLCYADGRQRDELNGIRFGCRTGGHLLKSWPIQAPARLSTTTVHDPLFACECALNTATEADMQRSINLFASGCANFGLTINTDKTVVMHQLPHNAVSNDPRIHAIYTRLKTVGNFVYLGSTFWRCIKIDEEVTYRIFKVNQVFRWTAEFRMESPPSLP
nr:unnamed protein product [Spirometra erinaceieuropaei]